MCWSIGIVKQSKTQGQTYSVALGTPMFNTSVLGIFFIVTVKQLPHGWSNQTLKMSVIDNAIYFWSFGITTYLYVNQCLA